MAGDPAVDDTQTHQVIVSVGYGVGPQVARRLEQNHIIVNYQATPDEEGFTASGALRMGVSEMTRFGFGKEEFSQLAELFADCILRSRDVSGDVERLRAAHTQMQYCFLDQQFQNALEDFAGQIGLLFEKYINGGHTMKHPNELQYTKSHEWIKTEDGVTLVGISDFAQDALGDVVFINLPAEGDQVTAGEAFGDVESVKAVSDLISPVTGVVCAVNEELLDAPELLNHNPYGAWIMKVEQVTETEELMDAGDYEAFCAEE